MNGDPFGLIGRVIDGKFRVDALVGEGDLSVLYRGFHLGIQAPVAIKCLHLPDTLDPELTRPVVAAFEDAGRLHGHLGQGTLHVAQTLAYGRTIAPLTGTSIPYRVREWFEGEPLASELAQRRRSGVRPRTVDEAFALLAPAIEGIAHAHDQGVAHLSLDPGNLFLARDEGSPVLKVLDFGTARASVSANARATLDSELTRGLHLLHPAFAAPEQLDMEVGDPGTWTDVYALALIMMDVLAERSSVEGHDTGALVDRAIDRRKRPTPAVHGLSLAPALDRVLTRAVALSPENRQENARVLLNELTDAMGAGAPQRASARAPSLRAVAMSKPAPPPRGATTAASKPPPRVASTGPSLKPPPLRAAPTTASLKPPAPRSNARSTASLKPPAPRSNARSTASLTPPAPRPIARSTTSLKPAALQKQGLARSAVASTPAPAVERAPALQAAPIVMLAPPPPSQTPEATALSDPSPSPSQAQETTTLPRPSPSGTPETAALPRLSPAQTPETTALRDPPPSRRQETTALPLPSQTQGAPALRDPRPSPAQTQGATPVRDPQPSPAEAPETTALRDPPPWPRPPEAPPPAPAAAASGPVVAAQGPEDRSMARRISAPSLLLPHASPDPTLVDFEEKVTRRRWRPSPRSLRIALVAAGALFGIVTVLIASLGGHRRIETARPAPSASALASAAATRPAVAPPTPAAVEGVAARAPTSLPPGDPAPRAHAPAAPAVAAEPLAAATPPTSDAKPKRGAHAHPTVAQPVVRFSRAAAQRAISGVIRKVSRCRHGRFWGNGYATVAFDEDGSVERVLVDPPFSMTVTGKCVADALEAAHMRSFSGKTGYYRFRFFIAR